MKYTIIPRQDSVLSNLSRGYTDQIHPINTDIIDILGYDYSSGIYQFGKKCCATDILIKLEILKCINAI